MKYSNSKCRFQSPRPAQRILLFGRRSDHLSLVGTKFCVKMECILKTSGQSFSGRLPSQQNLESSVSSTNRRWLFPCRFDMVSAGWRTRSTKSVYDLDVVIFVSLYITEQRIRDCRESPRHVKTECAFLAKCNLVANRVIAEFGITDFC